MRLHRFLLEAGRCPGQAPCLPRATCPRRMDMGPSQALGRCRRRARLSTMAVGMRLPPGCCRLRAICLRSMDTETSPGQAHSRRRAMRRRSWRRIPRHVRTPTHTPMGAQRLRRRLRLGMGLSRRPGQLLVSDGQPSPLMGPSLRHLGWSPWVTPHPTRAVGLSRPPGHCRQRGRRPIMGLGPFPPPGH
jgi:hypothetical protein